MSGHESGPDRRGLLSTHLGDTRRDFPSTSNLMRRADRRRDSSLRIHTILPPISGLVYTGHERTSVIDRAFRPETYTQASCAPRAVLPEKPLNPRGIAPLPSPASWVAPQRETHSVPDPTPRTHELGKRRRAGARARSSTSDCLSGGSGVDGMMASGPGERFSSAVPSIAVVYNNSTNFRDAHWNRGPG